jgi:hypothetical protein
MHWKLFNRNSASMHPNPHGKRASKLISNKRKPEKTHNLPSWIFKIPTIDMIFGAMQRDN